MFKLKIDEELSLCLISPMFADQMFNIIDKHRDTLSQWLSWPKHTKQPSDYAAFAQSELKRYAEGKALPCCIEYRGELVGAVGFNTIFPDTKRATVGYWLSPEYEGKGIMTRACQTLFELAFNELNLEKVQLSAAEGNQPSRSVAERLGMTLEGIITNSESLNGRIVDHAVYGLHKTV